MNVAAIVSRPRLAEELEAREWKGIFNRRTLDRAVEYTQPHRLLKLESVTAEDSIIVVAIFRGNATLIYETRLRFFQISDGGWNLEEECSCPVTYECKHSAAALLAVCDELARLKADGTFSPDVTDQRVDQWISEVNQSLAPPPKAAPKTKKASHFLAYCITPPERPFESHHVLSLHVGRTLKDGRVKINLDSMANVDPLRPNKYMEANDFLPCTLYLEFFRGNPGAFRGVPLQGPHTVVLLQEILKTGRLFDACRETGPRLVEPGDPITPDPIWEDRDDGTSRPTFAAPLPPRPTILKTEPPYLLLTDPENPEAVGLHPLDISQHSLAFLEAWGEGPTLQGEQVAAVATRFQNESPTLPKPVPAECEALKKSPPALHLKLHRANPFSHGGLHLSGHPDPIIATLTFRYHGHPFTPDVSQEAPADASFIASKKGTVFQIPRDLDSEQEAIAKLAREHQLVPASAHDPRIATGHASAFLPDTPPAQWDPAAAEFITRSVPRLREAGWTVTLDPTADLEIHSVSPEDLDTQLSEDPERGIDWFQFSASYLTPAGEKQPLLPLLSTFLKQLDFDSLDETLANLEEGDETLLRDPDDPRGFLAFPTARLLRLAKTLHDLFGTHSPEEPLHRLQAAALANSLEMDSSQTHQDLAQLGKNLANVTSLPRPKTPKNLQAELRDYQVEGFHWMQFLARHSLHGILADDMGLGKTLQTLTHLQAEVSGRRTKKTPSLVVAPTSVVGNWQAEARKFTPRLKTLLLHGPDRKQLFQDIPQAHLVITSYALLVRDFEVLKKQEFHLLILDEAQYIKNPAAKVSQLACRLQGRHRLSLSGTPLENHLGELWSQMRFLMPGLLGSADTFQKRFRTPIEKNQDPAAQLSLNSRVAPLILRRTKEAVATELPPKTEILHPISLYPGQVDLYETVRAAMDDRIRDAIADKGLAKSQIIVLDALLKLRQICCHPQLLKLAAAQKVKQSAKLDFLTQDLLPTLLEEGRKILIFSTFTTMLALIEKHLEKKKVAFSKITGSTKKRQDQIDRFQEGETAVFLISLKAGGTGLNLTAADTVIHYDPWWNPAAENQATDRAYRIGQDKPVFVHKLITEGSIEERIVQLQSQKAKLVEALLSEETSKLQLDQETLGNLLAPLE